MSATCTYKTLPPSIASPPPAATEQLTALSAAASQGAAPATFTPFPDEIYLSFIDRLAEVVSLISDPHTLKLLSLLAQVMSPHGPMHPQIPYLWIRANAPMPSSRISARHLLARPTPISYLFHAEFIWERYKGLLGVPHELDVDVEWISYYLGKCDSEGEDEGLTMCGRRSRWFTS